VSGFSKELISRSGYETSGFAAAYDQHRPAPPAVVREVLIRCVGGVRPELIVDLGCGTGLSTRLWVGHADRIVGVEANPVMVLQAREATTHPAVEFEERFAGDTGLPDCAADIITCAQSFHWMDPHQVLPEAARLLRPGGVFAAYDYDMVPVIEPHVDAAFAALIQARAEARDQLGLQAGAATWPKHLHATRMQESGLFAHVREVHCHAEGQANADDIIGLAHSIGGPIELFGDQAPQVEQAMQHLTETAHQHLGEPRPTLTGYTIRLGITHNT
jgi:SAM-dependent methyltransferase